MQRKMKIIDLYKKNKLTFFIYVLLIIIVFIMVAVVLMPSIFYDQWIWRHYWGPVVADAAGGVAYHNGIRADEGYTMIAEITYGIILIFALYGLYKLFKRLKIDVNWRFALALMPYILYGPISRVLEDAGYFDEPIVYWFISPFIYVQIAFFALLFLLFGYYLEKRLKNPKITTNRILFIGGLVFLLPSLYLVAKWMIGDQWGPTTGVRFDVFLIIIALVFLIVGAVYLATYIFKNKEKFAVYKNPLNLSMFIGHLIDGLTSYISIKDPFLMGLNYAEKHPASNLLLEIWGPLFPIVKFILIIVVIYIFDIYFKDELKNYSNLVNMLKICILILGFSPGVRDLLRVTMGV